MADNLLYRYPLGFKNFYGLLYKVQVRVKKIAPNKKGDIGIEVYTTYVNPTPMSLLVNLVSSSDGNDIGVGLT